MPAPENQAHDPDILRLAIAGGGPWFLRHARDVSQAYVGVRARPRDSFP